MPKIDKPILFDTPEADAIVSALEVFPSDNPWNLVVEDWPLHPNSTEHHRVDRREASRSATTPTWAIVSGAARPEEGRRQARAATRRVGQGPYPVPDNTPIEGWPRTAMRTKGLTLDDVQRDKMKEDGDRHAIVVDPTNRMLYEFFTMKKTDDGWQARRARHLRSQDEQAAARWLDLEPTRPGCRSSPRSSATTRSSAAWSSMPCA